MKKIYIGIITSVFLIFVAASGFFLITPKVLRAYPQDHSQDIQVDSKVQIDFLIPVNRDFLIPSIKPDIPGKWEYRKPVVKERLYRSLVFVPEQILKPETTYTVKLKDIQGIVSLRKPYNFEFSFSTQPLPKVVRVDPENGAKEILPFSQIKVKLSHPNPKLVDLEFISEPEVEFNVQLNKDKDEYTLVPKEDFLQGVKYQFYIRSTFRILDKETKKVIFQDEPEELYRGTFETAPPPKILSFSPTGSNILINDNIEISFTESMLRESVERNFSINPSIEGVFTWSEDNKNLIFNPSKALPYGTNFQAVLKKGTEDEEGKYFPKDITFSFKSIGRVWVSFTPSNGSNGVWVNSSVKIYFDQSIDKDSAKERFKIEPKVNGSLSFSKNTMIFDPSQSLAYQTTYKVTILSGVKSIYGLDSDRTFSTSFTTQYQTFKLPILLDFQDYPLSCEAAALKMALRYKGIGVSENQIMNYVGIDPDPRQGNIWGDPYNIYVGSLNGRQNSTGYGVYWSPIARAAKVWRPASQSFSGWGVSDLTKELKSGNPIVVWGVIGAGAYQDSWYTQDGKYIYAWKGEHARVVIGFIGSSANPTKFILNDPYVGQIYWSTSSFLSNWNIFNRSGVVVR